MAQRRIVGVEKHRNKPRAGISSASIASTASTTANLISFEGLSDDEVAFIDSIICRVPSSVTTFVPVFKAYQDEFEERELNATDDQFYYNLLLKLGMIRAENWQQKWDIVKKHFNYAPREQQPRSTILADEKRRASLYHPPVEDDDAFTLHSNEESAVGYPAPPSYTSKQRPISLDIRHTQQQERLRQASTSTQTSVRRNHLLSARTNVARRPLSSATKDDGSQSGNPSPTAAVPPSYHTLTRTANVVQSTSPREDVDPWRLIEMERDADLFRRDSLLSRCLDVWVKGLHWVENTCTQLDNARAEYTLRTVLAKWREKSTAALAETKRAATMDRARLLSSALSKWRLRTWTTRRKRWAEEMRGRLTQMQGKTDKRILTEFFARWKKSHYLNVASRQCELLVIQKVLGKWNQQLRRIAELSNRSDQVVKYNDAVRLERALETWKRQTHFSVAVKILRARQTDRIQWNALRVWQQRTHIQSVACGFSEARIMRYALRRWIQRGERLKYLERRAIAHKNRPLIRAVFHIWQIKARQQQYAKDNGRRVLAAALKTWKASIQRKRDKELMALTFISRVDQRLVRNHLKAWALQYAARQRMERRAQRAYEMTIKAKVLIQWKMAMWLHAKAMKDAKLVHRLFVERAVWKRWRVLAEQKRREKKLVAFKGKLLGRAFHLWQEKTKQVKIMRRKEEVVAMVVQARLLQSTLRKWTLRVVYLKDREFCVMQERRDRVVKEFFHRWRRAMDRQQENTSLMLSFQDVRREETMRRILNVWVYATRRKRTLQERAEEFKKSLVSRAFERWYDRYLENSLRPMELDVRLQSQTNLLFKTFRIWEARTHSIPAIRFRAQHTRANAWRKWRAAMPAAMRRKEARDHDHQILLRNSLMRWRERYQSKISAKAIARARYLRLPPAPAKPPTPRVIPAKPGAGPRSYRSASPDRPISAPVKRPTIIPPRAPESNRAPSPTSTRASFQGLGDLIRRRPMLTGPSSAGAGSRSSLDGKRESGFSWDGIGTTRARARAAFSAGFRRPASAYEESKEADSDDS